MKKRAQLGWPEILGWVIGILFLAIFIGFMIYLKKTDQSALDYIKTLLRFRR